MLIIIHLQGGLLSWWLNIHQSQLTTSVQRTYVHIHAYTLNFPSVLHMHLLFTCRPFTRCEMKRSPPTQWHLTNFTSSLPLFLFDCLVSFPSPSNLSPLSLLPSFNAYIMTHSKSKAVGRTGCLCSLSEETSQASCSAYSLTSFPLLQRSLCVRKVTCLHWWLARYGCLAP